MAKGPKQKTHKASSKVFKKRKNGTLSYKRSGGNHQTNKDTSKAIRKRRKQGTLSKGDTGKIKSAI